MEVTDLFDPSVKQEINERINKLTVKTQRQWGKMNVSQMLAHVQMPIRIALGTHQPKGNFLLRLIGPLFKSKLWDEKPYKQSLPTDPTFVMTGTEKDFEKEKAALIELVNNFNETSIQSDRHPVFGKLNKHNWSKATWKHLDHHLRQFGV
jgi:hypothetical protein